MNISDFSVWYGSTIIISYPTNFTVIIQHPRTSRLDTLRYGWDTGCRQVRPPKRPNGEVFSVFSPSFLLWPSSLKYELLFLYHPPSYDSSPQEWAMKQRFFWLMTTYKVRIRSLCACLPRSGCWWAWCCFPCTCFLPAPRAIGMAAFPSKRKSCGFAAQRVLYWFSWTLWPFRMAC